MRVVMLVLTFKVEYRITSRLPANKKMEMPCFETQDTPSQQHTFLSCEHLLSRARVPHCRHHVAFHRQSKTEQPSNRLL